MEQFFQTFSLLGFETGDVAFEFMNRSQTSLVRGNGFLVTS